MAPHLRRAELQCTIAGGFALVDVKMMSGVAVSARMQSHYLSRLSQLPREQEPARDEERGQRLCEGATKDFCRCASADHGGQGPPRWRRRPATTTTGPNVGPQATAQAVEGVVVGECEEGPPAPMRRHETCCETCERRRGGGSRSMLNYSNRMPSRVSNRASTRMISRMEEGTRIRVFWSGMKMVPWHCGQVRRDRTQMACELRRWRSAKGRWPTPTSGGRCCPHAAWQIGPGARGHAGAASVPKNDPGSTGTWKDVQVYK